MAKLCIPTSSFDLFSTEMRLVGLKKINTVPSVLICPLDRVIKVSPQWNLTTKWVTWRVSVRNAIVTQCTLNPICTNVHYTLICEILSRKIHTYKNITYDIPVRHDTCKHFNDRSKTEYLDLYSFFVVRDHLSKRRKICAYCYFLSMPFDLFSHLIGS